MKRSEAGDARQLPAGAARAAPMAAAARAGSGQRACAPRPGAVGKGGGGRARARLGQSRPGSRLGGAGKAGPRGPPSRKRAVGAEVGRSGRKQRLHSSEQRRCWPPASRPAGRAHGPARAVAPRPRPGGSSRGLRPLLQVNRRCSGPASLLKAGGRVALPCAPGLAPGQSIAAINRFSSS